MNCDCIEKLQQGLMEHLGITERDFQNKVEIPLQIKIVGNAMIGTTFTEAIVRIKGKKTLKKVEHNFCPFCGKTVEKEVNNAS